MTRRSRMGRLRSRAPARTDHSLGNYMNDNFMYDRRLLLDEPEVVLLFLFSICSLHRAVTTYLLYSHSLEVYIHAPENNDSAHVGWCGQQIPFILMASGRDLGNTSIISLLDLTNPRVRRHNARGAGSRSSRHMHSYHTLHFRERRVCIPLYNRVVWRQPQIYLALRRLGIQRIMTRTSR